MQTCAQGLEDSISKTQDTEIEPNLPSKQAKKASSKAKASKSSSASKAKAAKEKEDEESACAHIDPKDLITDLTRLNSKELYYVVYLRAKTEAELENEEAVSSAQNDKICPHTRIVSYLAGQFNNLVCDPKIL